jgi:hypothetical protein
LHVVVARGYERVMSRTSLSVFLAAIHGLAAVACAAVAVPTVTGPVAGPGRPFVASTGFDLAPHGYVEEEFFLSGTATGFTSATPLTSDGRWTALPAATAPYQTRILVRRPADASRFNGTVVVEWLNVSAGLDAAPDWLFAHTLLMRDGYAWVGVSAQVAGITGGGGPLGLNLTLQGQNPARYGPLVHPGDTFSYDMFSQVAAAIRGEAAVLGGLRLRRVLAVGESQSAFRLVTYVNAVHLLARAYDGFLIHSRSGSGAPLSQAPEPVVNVPDVVTIRDDLDGPVLTLQTETDLVALGSLPARQPDARRFRLWEVAGTAHGDLYQLLVGAGDQGPAAIDTTYHAPVSAPIPGIIMCDRPVNAGPQHFVVSAAVAQLDRWTRTGKPPPPVPRLEVQGDVFVVDEHGNVRGGARTPQVDVPIATLSGLGQTGAAFCRLFGTTVPFDGAKLAALYPTHARYLKAIRRAARRAVRRGVLLRVDAKGIIAAAEASSVGG